MSSKLIILDFDGTLFDTHAAIAHSITKAFDVLLPTHVLPQSNVQQAIGSGRGLKDVLTRLHPDPNTLSEEEWTSTYRRIYAEEGQKLVKPYTGAENLLRRLHSQNIPIAIVTNKNVAAVTTALDNHGLGNLIPEELIIGDRTPGATRKPDPASYFNILLPALAKRGLVKGFDGLDVVVVGDTEMDLRYASNIDGARAIWCRYGYGDKVACEGLSPYKTVDSLAEVEQIICM